MISESYEKIINQYRYFLQQEEKSQATIEKYLRDVKTFLNFMDGREITKEETIAYKQYLIGKYAPASVNSMLAALNQFLHYIGKAGCRVKQLKIQKNVFASEEKLLTKADYQKLLAAAGNSRTALIMQTICGTGIRVSELKYITAEAVLAGKTTIYNKGKMRIVFIPHQLGKSLKKYIRKNSIKHGPVFVTKNGKPLDRSNIWKLMKGLCEKAKVSAQKVFPHNLRHLFARTFYSLKNDIVRLADILGHSSIDTTRIYTMETGWQHQTMLEKVQRKLTT